MGLPGQVGNRTLGAYGGAEAHTQSVAEMAAHNHPLNDPGHAHYIVPPSGVGGGVPWGGGSAAGSGSYPTNATGTGITIANAGSGLPMSISGPVRSRQLDHKNVRRL